MAASHALAAAPLVVSRRVIELGCGPGAVGLTAAALGAAAVTLTDLPHLLPLVQQNIEVGGRLCVLLCSACRSKTDGRACTHIALLRPPLSPPPAHTAAAATQANGLGATAAAAPLEWGTSVGHLSPPCDLVLASDVLYQAEALPLFVQTLAALSGPRTLALLCNERRAPLPFPRALFEGAGFSVAAVPLKEQHPEWRSEDIELFRISRAPADS